MSVCQTTACNMSVGDAVDVCVCVCVTGRGVSDPVHTDAGCCWYSAVLHGTRAGTVQQEGRHYVLGSTLSALQRYIIYIPYGKHIPEINVSQVGYSIIIIIIIYSMYILPC